MCLKDFKFFDLTHPLSPDVPTWNGSCGFCLEIKKDYDQQFRVQQIKSHAGIGTHMDAPCHRFEGAASIADIPLERLILPACVIDISAKATADYKVSTEDVRDYESRQGLIPEGSLVIAYTGWSRFWTNPAAYRNVGSDGQMHFPTISAEVAALLLERNVHGIAIDTLSPDAPQSDFPVHRLILGAGKYIIENINDCSKMPAQGGYVIALPLRMEQAAESPLRILGWVTTSR